MRDRLRDASLIRVLPKLPEMLAIVRQYDSAVCVRERQHFLVWDPQTGQVDLGYREDVVSESPQSFDGWVGKVLISEEAGQRLGPLILSDLTVDFVEVSGNKRPGVDQVGRSECGECAEDLGFSQTEPPVVLERPNRDSCSGNPRITTTYPRRSLDP